LTQTFDFVALEAAWQAADRATAIYEMLTEPLLDQLSAAATSKYGAAFPDPAAGLDKATRAALDQAAATSRYGAAFPDPAAGLDG